MLEISKPNPVGVLYKGRFFASLMNAEHSFDPLGLLPQKIITNRWMIEEFQNEVERLKKLPGKWYIEIDETGSMVDRFDANELFHRDMIVFDNKTTDQLKTIKDQLTKEIQDGKRFIFNVNFPASITTMENFTQYSIVNSVNNLNAFYLDKIGLI